MTRSGVFDLVRCREGGGSRDKLLIFSLTRTDPSPHSSNRAKTRPCPSACRQPDPTRILERQEWTLDLDKSADGLINAEPAIIWSKTNHFSIFSRYNLLITSLLRSFNWIKLQDCSLITKYCYAKCCQVN